MLWALMLASAAETPPDAALEAFAVDHGSAGLCTDGALVSSASVEVSWTATNVSDATHRVRVYEDGVLQTTALPSAGSWLRPVTGYVLDGAFDTFASDWVFSVELVRLSDSAVVDSATAAAWVQTYGTCAVSDA